MQDRTSHPDKSQRRVQFGPTGFESTGGDASRTRKIDAVMAQRIRELYDAGERGTKHAKRFGISAVQFNKIGRRKAWKALDNDTQQEASRQQADID